MFQNFLISTDCKFYWGDGNISIGSVISIRQPDNHIDTENPRLYYGKNHQNSYNSKLTLTLIVMYLTLSVRDFAVS